MGRGVGRRSERDARMDANANVGLDLSVVSVVLLCVSVHAKRKFAPDP